MTFQHSHERPSFESESTLLELKAIAPPPQTIGKFEVVGELGRGGMGVVFEARDAVLGRRVALKVRAKAINDEPHDAERFLREARALASLQHPHVVAAYEADVVDGHYLIALELMDGGSLQDSLKRGPLSVRAATRGIAQACRGLAAAHRAGVIHRDIKPSNLLRSAEGSVKLSDFGLARPHAPSGETLTGSGSVLGTPQYMSPEQCRSERADERSDLYSLGATYFALLTGRAPYAGAAPLLVMNAHLLDPVPDPRDLVPTLPEDCSAIVIRAMAKDPDDRFQSAEEMLLALEALLAQLPDDGSEAAEATLVDRTPAVVAHEDGEATSIDSSDDGATELSWGRGTRTVREERRDGHVGNVPHMRRRGLLGALLVVGVLLAFWGVVSGRKDDAKKNVEHVSSVPEMPTVEPAVIVEKADRQDEPVENVPHLPLPKRRLALPVVELPPDAFRLADMKVDEVARADRRDVWECSISGLSHVAIAQSGAFMVTLARASSMELGLQTRVDVWGQNGQRIGSMMFNGKPSGLAVSADSRRVAIATEAAPGVSVFESALWRSDVIGDLEQSIPPGAERDASLAVALSDDARWLAYSVAQTKDAQWVLCDLKREHDARRFVLPERGPLRAITMAAGPELLIATGGDGGNFHVWHGLPHDETKYSSPVWPAVKSLAFGPEHALLAIRAGQTVSFFRTSDHSRQSQFGVPDNSTPVMAFSPHGEQLALAIGRWVRVVALDTQQSVANLRGFVEPVIAITYLPDGSGLVVGCADGKLKLFRGMTRSD